MKLRFTAVLVFLLAAVTVASAQTKISGTSQCGKPDPMNMLQVGDTPGHAVSIAQSKCTWTKPMDIAGIQTKDDVVTASAEARGDKSRDHGYVVGTMSNGDKMFVHFHGSGTMKDGAPDTAEGEWEFAGGTGKLKGIKGKGTYKGKAGPEGITYEVEGEYTIPK
jgi:hypothetical protein